MAERQRIFTELPVPCLQEATPCKKYFADFLCACTCNHGTGYGIIRTRMAQVRPELKAKLITDGKWADFVRYRSDLISGGAKPAAALREAMKRFCPEFVGDAVAPDTKAARAEKRGEAVSGRRAKDAADAAAIAASVDSAKSSSCTVEAKVFRGKAFSSKDAPATVAWVLERIFVKDVKPEDAPSGMAWTLLAMCKRSTAFAEDFVSKSIVKMIPAKPPDEDRSSDDDFDGKLEYDILGRLLDGGGR